MNRIHFLRGCWHDIILIESNGLFAMVDTGIDMVADQIQAYLDQLGVKRLEFILITHFHRDHYGSLPALLGRYPVGKVYMKTFSGLNITDSAGKPASKEYNEDELRKCAEMCELSRRVSELVIIDETVDQVSLGDFRFRLYGLTDGIKEMYDDPESPYYQQVVFGENVNSIAMFAEVNGTTVYLGGDAHNSELDYPKYSNQNDQYAEAVGKQIDLYKVPHHCCGNIFNEHTLDILRPRYAVVTNFSKAVNGPFAGNRDLMLQANPEVKILCTDLCGYAFTLGAEGDLSYEEIDPWPEDKEKPPWMQ